MNATTTLVFETSHTAGDRSKRDHIATIAKEAGMTRTYAYRDNAKGTDHDTYTLEVPTDHADDTGRDIAQDLTANGIRTTWYDASEPGPDPAPRPATPEEPTETLTLTTPDTFCSAQVKATAALAGFTRTDETTWTRTATKAEADRIFFELPKALRATAPKAGWHLGRIQMTTPETPETAAARFWREGSEAQGGGTPEFDPAEVETWLDKNAPTGDHRRRTRIAIFETAEPMNLPTLTPRLTEDDLRDILSDTRTDLAAAKEARDKAEQEAHHAKEDSEAAQERIEELEDALEEAEAKAEERINDTLTDLEAAEKRAKFWEEEHERNRDRISRILDAYFKRDDLAAREAAGAGPFLKAKIRTNAALTTVEEKALIDLIDLTEEMADDGTPNGRDAWAGPTADDDETGWRAAAAKKTTDNE